MKIENSIKNHFKKYAFIYALFILYFIGVFLNVKSMQQDIDCGGPWMITLQGMIKKSYLPLNFIMIPYIIICMNIKPFVKDDFVYIRKILKKLKTVIITALSLFILNIVFFTVIACICNVYYKHYFYYLRGYALETIAFLIVCQAIGLFMGQIINEKFGLIVSGICIIVLFVLLSNEYMPFDSIIPLVDLRLFKTENIYDLGHNFSYDKIFVFHYLFWIAGAALLLIFALRNKYNITSSKKKLIRIVSIIILCILSIWFLAATFFLKPVQNNIDKDAKGMQKLYICMK